MRFDTKIDAHTVPMDSHGPIGGDSAPTPKELLLAAVCGCTAMDVISLMRKYKQEVKTFAIEGTADQTEHHPKIFKQVKLTYRFTGNIDAAKAHEAVHLSQSLYCGVSAMISKAVPISYSIEINGAMTSEGKSEFKF